MADSNIICKLEQCLYNNKEGGCDLKETELDGMGICISCSLLGASKELKRRRRELFSKLPLRLSEE